MDYTDTIDVIGVIALELLDRIGPERGSPIELLDSADVEALERSAGVLTAFMTISEVNGIEPPTGIEDATSLLIRTAGTWRQSIGTGNE